MIMQKSIILEEIKGFSDTISYIIYRDNFPLKCPFGKFDYCCGECPAFTIVYHDYQPQIVKLKCFPQEVSLLVKQFLQK